ncbi:MAG: thymidine phosphorylase [Clostridia bacterium]
MKISDIIEYKRDGYELSREYLDFFINGYASGDVSDAEASALFMAITLKGLTENETYELAESIAHSGDFFNISKIIGTCVDKHSVGGFTDPVTLITIPIMSALGLKVLKISNNGYGEYRRTLDRASFFKGFNSSLTSAQMIKNLNSVGCVIASRPSSLVPIEPDIYSLRKATGTLPSIPLIAACTMAKKIAIGCNVLVLDVKCGEGSQLSSLSQAVELGSLMVKIGARAGIATSAIVSTVNEPLGRYMGSSLEVRETIELLSSKGTIEDTDLYKISREIVTNALILSKVCRGRNDAYDKIEEAILSGKALQKMKDMIIAQGGDITVIDNPDLLLPTKNMTYITAPDEGYITNIDVLAVNYAASILGFDKEGVKLTDPDIGVEFFVKEGDRVKSGDKMARIFYSLSDPAFASAIKIMREAFVIGKNRPKAREFICKIII